MLVWIALIVGSIPLLVVRSWRRDASLRAGEVVDIRDIMPEGEGDLEVRALAGRRYRLELQFEVASGYCSEDSSRAPGHPAGDDGFPYHVVVTTADGKPLYERERSLEELFGLAWSSTESTGAGAGRVLHARHWGCVPLLEFQTSALGRLKLEFSIRTTKVGAEEGINGGDGSYARVEKGWLILQEDVRGNHHSETLLDRVDFELGTLI